MLADFYHKIVISDTSCLIGFANIGRLDILRDLCPSLITTPEVAAEYKDPLPDWIQIIKVHNTAKTKSISALLGSGESSAIALALETENSLVILDDKDARHYAEFLGLDIIGTVGLLRLGYKKGIVPDIDDVISKLRNIKFRMPVNVEVLIKN